MNVEHAPTALPATGAQVLAAMQETMQPARASLWLRPSPCREQGGGTTQSRAPPTALASAWVIEALTGTAPAIDELEGMQAACCATQQETPRTETHRRFPLPTGPPPSPTLNKHRLYRGWIGAHQILQTQQG
jgi:hypothetical protein